MALKNWLYAQVVMIRRRELDYKNQKYKTEIYNFQGQSAKTKHWFDHDHECLKENFKTREPDFCKELYQTKFRGDNTKNIKYFEYQLVMQK